MLRHLHTVASRKSVIVLLLTAMVAHGLPTRAVRHGLQGFLHTAWTFDSGLGAVFDVEQATDGFLWLTTSRGVLRFDGVRFESLDKVTNGAVQNNDVLSAFASSSGGVWLTTRTAGLLLWRHGQLLSYPDRRCTPAAQVGGIVEDLDGALWIQSTGGLSYFRASTCERIGPERGYAGGFPEAVFIDKTGTTWVKSQTGQLLFKRRAEWRFQLSDYAVNPHSGIVHLGQDPNDVMWIADAGGLRRLASRRTDESTLKPTKSLQRALSKINNFAFATDGSLWVATDDGVGRFKPETIMKQTGELNLSSAESFTPAEGLSSDAVWKISTDREGNVWVGTNSGLDRFRRSAFSQVALLHTHDHEIALAAGDSNSVWAASKNMPLTHVAADGSTTTIPKIMDVLCIRRDQNGRLWIASSNGPSLWHMSTNSPTRMPTPVADPQAIVTLQVDRNGDPWIYTLNGVSYQMKNGEWRPVNAALGKKSGILGAMAGDSDGNVWFAFSNQLVHWNGSTFERYSFPNGPLNISPATMAVKGDHVWLAGRGGVVLFTRGRFYLVRCKNPELPGRVSGVVETRQGELWMNGFSGVTRITAGALATWVQNPDKTIAAEHLDVADGLPGYSGERLPEPSIVESPNGRLWFATTRGIAWLDPETYDHSQNRVLPPVTTSSVVANGKTFPAWRDLSLPKYSDNIEVNYTALSLTMPERVLFRYKLEGYDKDWQNAGTRRQAFYTHLPPGRYRFRVTACNNNGIWNEAGTSLSITLAPAFYQTNWFLLLLFVAGLLLLWITYRLRVRRLADSMRARFDERLAERTRLARDLHDTLLQTVQGSKLVADDALENRNDPSQMQHAMEKLSEWLGQAVQEGREALNSLRVSSTETNDLASGFQRAIQDCVIRGSMEIAFSVKGEARDMHPIVRDEIYRIGYEAIRNASMHSGGSVLEVGIDYSQETLRIHIRDNGKGIDPVIAGRGKEGHFGLQGMRERAARIGATLSFTTGLGKGTGIELSVPGHTVFRKGIGKLQTRSPL